MKVLITFLTLRIEEYMLPCFSKQILGIDCPGCGLQRSAAFLLQGDFTAAWDMYPALFTIIPLFSFLAADQLFTIKHANKFIIILTISSVALILTNYILKFI